MKTTSSLRRLAFASAGLILLLAFAACGSRTEPMASDADPAKFIDFARAIRHLPGMDAAHVQREIGSPDDIERNESGRVRWFYDHRFCDRDARCIYKQVTLVFENDRLKAVEPR